MALTGVDKIKLNKYIKDHPIDGIYLGDMIDTLTKKKKPSDMELLEHFTECVVAEFNKDEKRSMKHVAKLIVVVDSFLGWIHEDGIEIRDEILDKIRSFEAFYDDYLNRNNFEIDLEFTDGVLAKMTAKVNELYPAISVKDELGVFLEELGLDESFANQIVDKVNELHEGEVKGDSLVKYLQEIDSLRNNLASLNRELQQLKERYEFLEGNHREKSDSLVVRNNELSKANQLIEKLQGLIVTLEERVKLLEIEIQSKQDSILELTPYKEQYQGLVDMIESLREDIANREKEKNDLLSKEQADREMEDVIYSRLLVSASSVDGLMKELKRNGYEVSKEEVYKLINNIKRNFNIESVGFLGSPRYSVVAPSICENGTFDITLPVDCNVFDIMLVSDFHLRDASVKVIDGVMRINEYCLANNINLILNIGDLFNGIGGRGSEVEDALANYKCVSDVISLIPRTEGIYHAVLGGNHDKKLLKYGIDPIGLLAREREDFINLGYTHCTITFNGSRSVLSSFGLHHPQRFDFPIDTDIDDFDTSDLLDELDAYYTANGSSRDNVYVDIFGHTHRSLINNPDSYCFVPSYFEGRTKRGACHLRIFFDEEMNIKSMVFKPLAVNEKLTKNTEIVYKKTLR